MGSSNITVYALLKNIEWDVSIIEEQEAETYKDAKKEFDALWERTLPLSRDLIEEYKTRLYYSIERWDMDYDIANSQYKPNYMQRRALRELNRIRAMGATKALIIRTLRSLTQISYSPRMSRWRIHWSCLTSMPLITLF